jgi:hypothetical protein
MPCLTVGQAAAELDCSPSLLSNALYRRELDAKRCPLVGARRMIPADYLPQIALWLRRRQYGRITK